MIQFQGDFIQLSPLIILELGNLEVFEEKIEKKIQLAHQNKLQYFQLIGYTLLFGNHFTLKTFIGTNCYHYQRRRNRGGHGIHGRHALKVAPTPLPLRWYEKEKNTI